MQIYECLVYPESLQAVEHVVLLFLIRGGVFNMCLDEWALVSTLLTTIVNCRGWSAQEADSWGAFYVHSAEGLLFSALGGSPAKK